MKHYTSLACNQETQLPKMKALRLLLAYSFLLPVFIISLHFFHSFVAILGQIFVLYLL